MDYSKLLAAICLLSITKELLSRQLGGEREKTNSFDLFLLPTERDKNPF